MTLQDLKIDRAALLRRTEMRLYRVALEYTAKRVVFIEASDCDEAADIALEDFKAEPQPDDVVEDGSAEVVESAHDRDS